MTHLHQKDRGGSFSFPHSSANLRWKHSLRRRVLWTWEVQRLRMKMSTLDLSLDEQLRVLNWVLDVINWVLDVLNWVVPLWWLEALKKKKKKHKTFHCDGGRDQLLAHIRYAQSTLVSPFCSDEFQEHMGLQWNKSGNYRSFPSNKASYS